MSFPSLSDSGASVEMPLDVLDAIVDELFAVGLALGAQARSREPEHRDATGPVLERLDRIIARVRQSALAASPTGQLRQADIMALSTLPNDQLPTIDLLDAAHSASRARLALQNRRTPDESPPVPAGGGAPDSWPQAAPSNTTVLPPTRSAAR